eukprot:scaffold18740_cov82-Skeletonema_dohrnii-CCMP3373.AAC.1
MGKESDATAALAKEHTRTATAVGEVVVGGSIESYDDTGPQKPATTVSDRKPATAVSNKKAPCKSATALSNEKLPRKSAAASNGDDSDEESDEEVTKKKMMTTKSRQHDTKKKPPTKAAAPPDFRSDKAVIYANKGAIQNGNVSRHFRKIRRIGKWCIGGLPRAFSNKN